jgi:hypothetical protein
MSSLVAKWRAFCAWTQSRIGDSRLVSGLELLLGAAFLLSGRNLWTCALAHGFIDTLGVVAVYFGWAD